MEIIRKILFNKHLILLIRFGLAFLFVVSGVLKIIEPQAFADSINGYKLLPIPVVNIFAIIIPWVELLAGLSLLTKQYLVSGSILIILLSFIFIVAVSSAMLRGLDINCGCFSITSNEKVGVGIILRDIGLVIAAYWLVKSHQLSNATSLKTHEY